MVRMCGAGGLVPQTRRGVEDERLGWGLWELYQIISDQKLFLTD